jgi:hypothetical protein
VKKSLSPAAGARTIPGQFSPLICFIALTMIRLIQSDALPGGYYRLTRPNADMKLIFESMGAAAELSLPTATEIRKLKKIADAAGML